LVEKSFIVVVNAFLETCFPTRSFLTEKVKGKKSSAVVHLSFENCFA
jgi:hypothetical protein